MGRDELLEQVRSKLNNYRKLEKLGEFLTAALLIAIVIMGGVALYNFNKVVDKINEGECIVEGIANATTFGEFKEEVSKSLSFVYAFIVYIATPMEALMIAGMFLIYLHMNENIYEVAVEILETFEVMLKNKNQ